MTLGTMATDVEQRIDFDELRSYRLGRAREQLVKNDFGAYLCFDLDNIRYITGTALAEWTRGKWVRWCVLPREGDLVLWEKSSAAAVKRQLCPVDQARKHSDIHRVEARRQPTRGHAEPDRQGGGGDQGGVGGARRRGYAAG